MNKLSSFMLCCSAVMMFSACTKDDQEDNTVLIKASIEIENNSVSFPNNFAHADING